MGHFIKKVYFLHNPKCGGSYIKRALENNSNFVILDEFCEKHAFKRKCRCKKEPLAIEKMLEIRKDPNAIVFSTVRNPFDLLVSWFYSGYFMGATKGVSIGFYDNVNISNKSFSFLYSNSFSQQALKIYSENKKEFWESCQRAGINNKIIGFSAGEKENYLYDIFLMNYCLKLWSMYILEHKTSFDILKQSFLEFINNLYLYEEKLNNQSNKEKYHNSDMDLLTKFMFYTFFDKQGACRVDEVIRMEEFDKELPKFCEKYNLHLKTPKDKVDRHGRDKAKDDKRFNISRQGLERNYKIFYTKKLVEFVNIKCADELKVFGYGWDGIVGDIMDLTQIQLTQYE